MKQVRQQPRLRVLQAMMLELQLFYTRPETRAVSAAEMSYLRCCHYVDLHFRSRIGREDVAVNHWNIIFWSKSVTS